MGVVFFGGFAISLYSRYMPKHIQKKFSNVPDFDVLSTNPKFTADILKSRLQDEGYKNVKVIFHEEIGEIVAPHYDIRVGNETVCFIYEPLACHSYNEIKVKGMYVRIATIDTMLSFYLAFLYTDRPYYNEDRILCMCEFLFKVQQKNRLEQKGLLKRFSINCYGIQATLGSIREEKAKKYEELKDKRGTKEWNEYFLRYVPKEIEGDKNKETKPKPKPSTPSKTRKHSPDKKKGTRKKKPLFFGAIKL
jgi:hypothetical protein